MEKDKVRNGINDFMSSFLQRFDKFLDLVVSKMGNVNGSPDLKKRIVSAAILLVLAIYAIYYSKGLFFLLVIAATILMAFEWLELTKSAADQQKWRLIGFFYILIPVWSILKLRDLNEDILLWMFLVIWSTDIFAYFAGRNFGGVKLAPTISPNKTWSGLAGGVFASMVIGFLSSFMFVSGNIFFFIIVSGLLAGLEQLSDLLESKFKRIFGVKDSGAIIPGHGGVLDRLDGLMLVAPTVLILVFVYSVFREPLSTWIEY